MYSIYIPLIQRELPDLEFLMLTWRLHPPLQKGSNLSVDLYVSFDQKTDNETEKKIQSMFSNFGFTSVQVISAELSPEEAIYIRHGQSFEKSKIPKFGCKSGPNLHFLFNQKEMLKKGYIATLQCETDMFPVKSFWLEEIFNSAPKNKVISGPIYRGPTRLGGRILRHVNGNALYVTSNINFPTFIDAIEKSLLYLIKERDMYSSAFDTSLFEFFHIFEVENSIQEITKLGSAHINSEDDIRNLISLIDYSSLILNFSGGVESSDKHPIELESIIEKYAKDCVVIHSPHARYHLAAKIIQLEISDDIRFINNYISTKLLPKEKREALYKKYITPSEFIRKAYARSGLNPFLWRP